MNQKRADNLQEGEYVHLIEWSEHCFDTVNNGNVHSNMTQRNSTASIQTHAEGLSTLDKRLCLTNRIFGCIMSELETSNLPGFAIICGNEQ